MSVPLALPSRRSPSPTPPPLLPPISPSPSASLPNHENRIIRGAIAPIRPSSPPSPTPRRQLRTQRSRRQSSPAAPSPLPGAVHTPPSPPQPLPVPPPLPPSPHAAHARKSRTHKDVYFTGTSTFLSLRVHSPLRHTCIAVVDHAYFDPFILFCILLNSALLAWDNPIETQSQTKKDILFSSEIAFLLIFSVEALLKTIALGFVANGRYSYIRNPWNQLDFLVVFVGYLQLILGDGDGYTALRSIRLLRPLRTISTNENMRLLVTSLIRSLPQMADVAMLLLFIFFVFGLVGLQLFSDSLSKQCFDNATGAVSNATDSRCGADDFTCPAGTTCRRGTNPNSGITGFDNIGMSLLTVLQCVSTEGWTDVMYVTFETVSYWASLYFLLLMIFGALFVVELVVAVIYQSYQQSKEQAERDREAQLNATLSLVEMGPLDEGDKARIAEARALKARLEHKRSLRERLSLTSGAWAAAPPPLPPPPPAPPSWDVTVDPPASPWRHAFYDVSMSPIFENAILALIVVNSIILATEHHNQGATMDDLLRYSNFVFTAIFFFEMVIKMIGMGVHGYFTDKFNIFDFIVVCINVLEIILEEAVQLETGTSALRAFRLLRLFKMARRWRDLYDLLKTVIESLQSVFNFTVVLVIFMFIYAVLGMQLFAGKLRDPETGEPSRTNFDSFGWSFVAVFQIIGGENWNEVMYDGITGAGWAATAYFVSLFVLGNFLLLNLFLAILLSHFSEDNEEKAAAFVEAARRAAAANGLHPQGSGSDGDDEDDDENNEDIANSDSASSRSRSLSHHDDTVEALPALNHPHAVNQPDEPPNTGPLTVRHIDNPSSSAAPQPPSRKRATAPPDFNYRVVLQSKPKSKAALPKSSPTPPIKPSLAPPVRTSSVSTARPSKSGVDTHLDVSPPEEIVESILINHRSLFLFPPGPARDWVAHLVSHPIFNSVILFFILLSTVLLAFEDPTRDDDDPETTLTRFLRVMDFITTSVFVLEMLLRVYAAGFVLHEGAYARNGWNVLDFFVVIVSVTDLAVDSSLGFLKAFRALRALRPLRLVRRMPRMRVVVESIIKAMPSMLTVLLITFLFFIIFGVAGVQLFKGLFYQCEDSSGNVTTDDRAACDANPATTWKNPDFGNFDDIFSAVLILFEVASMEMWPDVLYRAVDTTSLDRAPVRDNHPWAALYFVIFIVVAAFFLTNLFLGVVVDSFMEMKEQLEGYGFLTPRQRMWLQLKKMFLHARSKHVPEPPDTSSEARLRTFEVVVDPRFEVVIIALIVLNVLVLSLEYASMSASYELALVLLNWFFAFCFVVEAVLKIYGMGVLQYFEYGWNQFDFSLVLLSIIDIVLFSVGSSVGGFDPKLLRVLRVPRIVRLVQHLEGLRTLIHTLLFALTPLVNIGSLLILLFFMYAVMGMALFGGLPQDGEFLNEHANFDNPLFAMLTLFRISTGESWNGIMHDIRQHADSTADALAVPYFVSFILLGTFMMLNLFVAVVMEQFDDLAQKEVEKKDKTPLTLEDLQEFSRCWDSLSESVPFWKFWAKNRTEWLAVEKIESLFMSVSPPMGIRGLGYSRAEALRWIETLRLPLYETVQLVVDDSDEEQAATAETTATPTKAPHEERVYDVHYFECLVAVAHHAFRCRTRPEFDERVRRFVQGAHSQSVDLSVPSTATQGLIEDDDEIDQIAANVDAVREIQSAFARRYRQLGKIARRTQEEVDTGLTLPQPERKRILRKHHTAPSGSLASMISAAFAASSSPVGMVPQVDKSPRATSKSPSLRSGNSPSPRSGNARLIRQPSSPHFHRPNSLESEGEPYTPRGRHRRRKSVVLHELPKRRLRKPWTELLAHNEDEAPDYESAAREVRREHRRHRHGTRTKSRRHDVD